jgi:hypothetical protein
VNNLGFEDPVLPAYRGSRKATPESEQVGSRRCISLKDPDTTGQSAALCRAGVRAAGDRRGGVRGASAPEHLPEPGSPQFQREEPVRTDPETETIDAYKRVHLVYRGKYWGMKQRPCLLAREVVGGLAVVQSPSMPPKTQCLAEGDKQRLFPGRHWCSVPTLAWGRGGRCAWPTRTHDPAWLAPAA